VERNGIKEAFKEIQSFYERQNGLIDWCLASIISKSI
jgi:hypothetical protein